jgi:FG-GAP repeat
MKDQRALACGRDLAVSGRQRGDEDATQRDSRDGRRARAAGAERAPAQAIPPLDLESSFSQRWDGGSPDDESGTTAANAGDVNGDGTPDVVMGAASGAGEAYSLYGDATAEGDALDLMTGLTPAGGYRMDGLDPMVIRNAGWSVDNAGDLNGDRIPDQLMGAPGIDCSTPNAVYVVFGQRGPAPQVDLATVGAPGGSQGYLIEGAWPHARPGRRSRTSATSTMTGRPTP